MHKSLKAVSPAHAINAHYRAQLERSGCTQMSAGNGSCDISKTKAENAAQKPALNAWTPIFMRFTVMVLCYRLAWMKTALRTRRGIKRRDANTAF